MSRSDGRRGVHYWPAIAERYGLDLTIVNGTVDPTFRFMTLDWDGRIRMDPSSPYVMKGLLALRDRFDIAFACDTDHDRHGVVPGAPGCCRRITTSRSASLTCSPNRPEWRLDAAVGKTVVSSNVIDYAAARVRKTGLRGPGRLQVVRHRAPGRLARLCRRRRARDRLFFGGTAEVWTTDKDGIVAALLAAEIAARNDRDPGDLSRELAHAAGDRLRADRRTATPEEKSLLERGYAKGRHRIAPCGRGHFDGSDNGAGRRRSRSAASRSSRRTDGSPPVPRATEEVYKMYAESVRGEEHLRRIQRDAQDIIGRNLRGCWRGKISDSVKAHTGIFTTERGEGAGALIATMMVLSDMSTAPIAAGNTIPHGASTPAASGIATML